VCQRRFWHKKKERQMRTLKMEEVEIVSGGVLPVLIGILAFEWYEAGHIRSFIDGFLDGANR
jgi:hypothetical protein